MKASLSKEGKLTISPVDSTEEYALSKWKAENKVSPDNTTIETEVNKKVVGFHKREEKKGV